MGFDVRGLCLEVISEVAFPEPLLGALGGAGFCGVEPGPCAADANSLCLANGRFRAKVLDGRGFNDYFWVYYGALSDVEYELQVVDMETGECKLYQNAGGQQASVGDTAAFFRPEHGEHDLGR